MPQLGADPGALRSLATRLRDAARQLDEFAVSLERRVRSTGWTGIDADAFRRQWQLRDRPAMRGVADRFREAASVLDRQVQEQLRASAGDEQGLPAAARTTDRIPAPAPLPSPEPLPRSELRVAAGSEILGGLLLGGLSHELTVQQLPRGRSRVVLTETSNGGVAATGGASARIGRSGIALGASGRISGSVGSILRREYLVRDDEVWTTVARVEAELGVGRVARASAAVPGLGLVAAALGPAVSVWDRVLDHLPGPDIELANTVDRLGVAPTPDRVEELAELSLGAGAGAAVASSMGVQGGADVSGSVRYGTGRGGASGDSHIIELEGAVAATVGGSLLERLDLAAPDPLSRSVELRLEFFDTPADGVDLVVTTTSTDASCLRQQTSNVSLAGVSTAMLHLRAADPVEALRALIDIDLDPGSISTTSGEMAVSDHALGGGLSAGQGVGVSLSGDVEVQRLDRIR